MSRIKVRNPAGGEYSFNTREEFDHALAGGHITAEWEIFHTTTNRWLSVSVHPSFQAAANRKGKKAGQ